MSCDGKSGTWYAWTSRRSSWRRSASRTAHLAAAAASAESSTPTMINRGIGRSALLSRLPPRVNVGIGVPSQTVPSWSPAGVDRHHRWSSIVRTLVPPCSDDVTGGRAEPVHPLSLVVQMGDKGPDPCVLRALCADDAAVGDRIVVAAAMLSGWPIRDGEIIEVGSHGNRPTACAGPTTGERRSSSPVRARRSVIMSRPSQRLRPPPGHRRRRGEFAGASFSRRGLGAWICICSQDTSTTAHAVLHTGASTELNRRGETHRNPRDADVPEIGDEVAAVRALRHLADRLLSFASADIETAEGHGVHLRQ